MDTLAQFLADKLQTDIVVMRLIASMFLGYPVAMFYNFYIERLDITLRHLYLFTIGMGLCYWNFGLDIIHMFIGIFVTVVLNYLFFKTKVAVVSSFAFNMAYLIVGAYICNRGTYDINWTTPYCILCLRLIGLSWDLFDSLRPESARSAYQKRYALPNMPGFLELLAFCFTPTAFLIGPQFPMRHFQAFIDGSLRPDITLRNRTFTGCFIFNVKVQRTIVRFTVGLFGIVALSQLLTIYPAETMLTEEFQKEWSFFNRVIYMVAFSQLILMRYVAVWLIGEGASVLLGLGCTGFVHIKTKTNQSHATLFGQNPASHDSLRDGPVLKRRDSALDWWALDSEKRKSLIKSYDPNQIEIRDADHTACANVSICRYMLATNTDDLVAGFNINTNRWVLEYVYKRLRFLGNKNLSQVLSLLFLAAWHGTYSGYYVNFGCEFLTVASEKDFLTIVKRSKYNHFLYETWIGRILTNIIGKLHIIICLSTPITVFHFLQFKYWFPVMKSVYFYGAIYLFYPALRPLMKTIFPSNVHRSDAKTENDNLPNGNMVDKTK